jgi:hypothetical protein
LPRAGIAEHWHEYRKPKNETEQESNHTHPVKVNEPYTRPVLGHKHLTAEDSASGLSAPWSVVYTGVALEISDAEAAAEMPE